MTRRPWRDARRSAAAAALLVTAAGLAGCSSEGDEPRGTVESLGVSPTESVTPSETATEPAPASSSPTGSPAPVEESPSTGPASEGGCDPDVFTPTARVDVRRSTTQLLGFGVRSVPPEGTVNSPGYEVELFEALFSGIVDQDGAEVDGPLRDAVVQRIGEDVVRDGLDVLRVPLELRNDSTRSQDYVVYAFATRSEGSWSATACPGDVERPTPVETRGTFAAWQRLDHGVVECGADPSTLSRVAKDAQLNGCA